MANFELMRKLTRKQGGKMILLVLDGLGGLPRSAGGLTELEAAKTPNLDRLAQEGSNGLSLPVGRGIAPGSGPAHLALFGYDPLQYDVGRGVFSALGVGMDVGGEDVATRGNFCTLDEAGLVSDRRAGRIATEISAGLCEKLAAIELDGVRLEVRPVKEYRFVLVMRGDGLSAAVSDSDPQSTGLAPLKVEPLNDSPQAAHTAELANRWLDEAAKILKDERPANMALLRGFAQDPNLPKFDDVYKLQAGCVAAYPMYKGVSKLVGMQVVETASDITVADEFRRVVDVWNDYDFVFCHIKPTDSRGEDGDFDGKVAVIEEVDAALPALLDLQPDVLVVTGDHSTPATWKAHSWHPVPTLLWAPATHMPDGAESFGERAAMSGALGQFQATDLLPLMLAHAGRLDKFGA